MYRYGAPDVRALCVLLVDEEREALWRTYVAQSLYMLNAAVYKALGATYSMPTYLSMTGAEKRDNRTGQEIIDDVIRRLERGG